MTDKFRVTFDARGSGMSQREVDEVSTETLMTDVRAVIDAAGLDRFIAYADGGNILAVSTCLRLAIEMPDRVSHVARESPFMNMGELADTPYGRTAAPLAVLDWNVFIRTTCQILIGLDESSPLPGMLASAFLRWVDAEAGRKYMRVYEPVDLAPFLPQIRQPTIVMRQEPYVVPASCVQRVVARIPGAQFRQYSDPTYAQVATIMREFIEQGDERRRDEAQSPFRAVLFTDIVGHTEMMQRLGDARGREVLREHERITRDALSTHGGQEVKTDGDSFMASFASVSSAVECAVDLQRALARYAETNGERIDVRIGLNVGEPIEEADEYFSSAVILGARIKDQAGGGEILVPEDVRHMLSGKGFMFSDRGEFVPKGSRTPCGCMKCGGGRRGDGRRTGGALRGDVGCYVFDVGGAFAPLV